MTRLQPGSSLSAIAAKVESGERLSPDDGVVLYRSRDIHEIGRLADLVRRRLHGDAAYFNVNRHINYTNYCTLQCKFCSFYRPYVRRFGKAARRGSDRLGEANRTGRSLAADARDDGYELSVEEVVEEAKEAYRAGATEVHIVGGLHPRLPFSYYVGLCRAIRAACPRIHIKAFTAIEIIHFSRIARPRLSVSDVLVQLREAGLDSLPGGGAEIFDERVHDEAHPHKVGGAGWFSVHRAAHELGIYSNATMLYGHIEGCEERIRHMIKLRAQQDQSLRTARAAFNCFVPLSFIPEGSAFAHLPGPTGLDDLKTLAISRLMLDNIPHIKAFWVMQGAKLAQVSLNWGVDDFDGTVVQYRIANSEGGCGGHGQDKALEGIKRLILEAGLRPVERDSLYRSVVRNGASWRLLTEKVVNKT
ncbi:MAG: CofH family radical SAM protein [Planctomycetota bacterium]